DAADLGLVVPGQFAGGGLVAGADAAEQVDEFRGGGHEQSPGLRGPARAGAAALPVYRTAWATARRPSAARRRGGADGRERKNEKNRGRRVRPVEELTLSLYDVRRPVLARFRREGAFSRNNSTALSARTTVCVSSADGPEAP